MNKTLTALATISLLLAPAALAESKSFDAKPFSSIEVKGAMDVVFSTAPQTQVTVETPGGDFSDAKIEFDGDTLVVTRNSLKTRRSFFSFWGNSLDISKDGETVKVNGKRVPRYTVHVSGPDLEAVRVSQSSRFTSDNIDADDFSASASSSAYVKLAGVSGNTGLSASSSGELKAADLQARTLRISASSSGEATGTVTGTGETVVDASSSGEATVVSKAAATFTVDVSSGGSAELSGACNSADLSASSGASIEADALRCESVTAGASSGGDIEAYATGPASGRASSGGSVEFAGNPSEQDSSESSGGSVRFTN
ncbi:MAG: hypothetical protein FP825_15310 [Hyphomonas sp.]|uniref:GIN domain-containing protein n=1 Tax=Hyphomonas sp. TaxID=87 RepID=UPI0017AFB9D9|nr:DUF2807 domain-containing protein [Hyphomonas sp.]MBA3069838.1 hypothetical protein [Hyphomonas sp.]MBU4062679.1 DUF2807 domain-containing protein [Alphaproteobacteria bacterium]MBU4164030.1 DUF2807 domain-containing protein [Alphaproteobacteria bacterium]